VNTGVDIFQVEQLVQVSIGRWRFAIGELGAGPFSAAPGYKQRGRKDGHAREDWRRGEAEVILGW